MKRYKNPALSLVDGVLTGHCICCGKYLGNEHDSNFYALIRRKYCKEHAQVYDEITTAIGRENYKQKNKRTVKEMGKCIDKFRVIVNKQDEYIQSLQRRINDLERSNQR